MNKRTLKLIAVLLAIFTPCLSFAYNNGFYGTDNTTSYNSETVNSLSNINAQGFYCGGYAHQYMQLQNTTLSKTYYSGVEVGDFFRYPACSGTETKRLLTNDVPTEDYGELKITMSGSYGTYYFYLTYEQGQPQRTRQDDLRRFRRFRR